MLLHSILQSEREERIVLLEALIDACNVLIFLSELCFVKLWCYTILSNLHFLFYYLRFYLIMKFFIVSLCFIKCIFLICFVFK